MLKLIPSLFLKEHRNVITNGNIVTISHINAKPYAIISKPFFLIFITMLLSKPRDFSMQHKFAQHKPPD